MNNYFKESIKQQLVNIIENEFGLWSEEDIQLAKNELKFRD